MKKVILTLLVGIALLQAGCKKFSEFQTDPNQTTNATPDLLLNSIEQSAFQSTDVNNALICRQMVYTDAVSVSQYYGWTRNSFGDYDNLRLVLKMEEAAASSNKTEYVPIAKFFRAWYFLRLTQLFGDIPYSQALKGDAGNYTPVYDNQQDIYLSILNDLKAANDLITANTTAIQGDIVFGGNMQQWKQAINSLSLRVLMSLSVKESNTTLDIKKRFADIVNNPTQYPILTGNADNIKLQYYDLEGNRYPYFNGNDIQTTNYMDETFVNLLKSLNDSRLFSFADKTPNAAALPITDFNAYGGVNGSAAININRARILTGTVSKINPRFYKNPINEPSIALGYAEVQFILAEGVVKGWITGTASDYYNKGIQASMLFYGIDQPTIDAYLLQNAVKLQGAQANQIKSIITQKYIASFMNSGLQPFFENRRTAENGNPGYPVFDVSGAGILNNGIIPKRWMYPDNESRLNGKNLTDAINRQYPGGDNINGVMWLLKP